jgi:dihydrofolate synthase / folylpolyglutamate synthase
MIAGLLREYGLRVGTYTSPHIEYLGERIAIDGHPTEGRDLARAIDSVRAAATRTRIKPSWFEVITAAGLWLFADAAVDVAVIEVGMLGRWDATNVVDGAVAVVTNVQLDHTDMAGPSRSAIASEKAGIVKSGATLILGEQDPALRRIFEARNPARIFTRGRQLGWHNRRVTPTGSVVDLVNPWGTRPGIRVGMIGEHQCDNALLALTAAEGFTGVAIPDEKVDRALNATHVPGRFEIVQQHPTVVLDGAHNPASAGALGRAGAEQFNGAKPRVLLYGAVRGRNPVDFLGRVGVRDVDLIVATEPESRRAMPARVLVEAARRFGVPATAVPSPERAVEAAIGAAGDDGVVIASGSLHLIGPLRAAMNGAMSRCPPTPHTPRPHGAGTDERQP